MNAVKAIAAQERAARSAGVVRAWHLGRRLADTIHAHDLPAPVAVWTVIYGGTGSANVMAEMSFAGLARLAARSKAHINAADSGEYADPQMWIDDEAVTYRARLTYFHMAREAGS